MKFLFALLFIPLLIIPAYAESQTLPTDAGALDVKISYDEIIPGELNKVLIEFINPVLKKTQVHIDYTLKISNESGEIIFTTPEPFVHTSEGFGNIPIELPDEGVYSMDVKVEGILFTPIPPETVSFVITVGEAHAQPIETPDNGENAGCLIATATFGSEMAPQVQQLRELRDNTILSTESGTAFMAGFNQFYYSFSPMIADLERENPVFKEVVKITLTPMLSSLSLLNYVDIDSEQEMLGYGISLILLNIGMYAGIPAFGILKLYQFRKN
ncbi:MAG: copper-binding protein [Nitrosopumilus sp.]|nr:copper-binding protein [Nitrosopumilus sp.]